MHKPEQNFHHENLTFCRALKIGKTKLQVEVPKLESKPFDGSVFNCENVWDRFDTSIQKIPF